MQSPRSQDEKQQSSSSQPSMASISSDGSLLPRRLKHPDTSSSRQISVRSVSSPNKDGSHTSVQVNPHVGDSYFTGTIYEHEKDPAVDIHESSIPRSIPRSYLDHIQRLSSQWPRLRYLANFMTSSTIPAKAKYLPVADHSERANRVKAAVLTIMDGAVQECQCSDRDSLIYHINMSSAGAKNRLIIVEDLSSTVIETLGSRFDIDPRFFRGHLEDHTWFNILDNWVEMPELESSFRHRSYVNLRYMQPRFFSNDEAAANAKDEMGQFNVLRRLDLEGQVKSGAGAWWEPSDNRVGLVRSKMSFWSRKDEDGWTGIILVDPTVRAGFPLWEGYGSLDKPTSMHTWDTQPTQSTVRPFYHNLIDRITSLSPPDLTHVRDNPEWIFTKIYPVIFAEILVTLQYSFTGLFQIEWELDSERKRDPATLDRCLDSLHKWQRRLPFYAGWMKDSIRALSGRYYEDEPEAWPMIADYKDILTRIEGLQHRADKIMSIATTVIAIEESKKAVIESQNMSRITYLAFVFVPMGFVASLLSMNLDFDSRGSVYWVFFAIALPTCVIAVIVAKSSRRLENVLRRISHGRQAKARHL